ncbi:MAG: DUF4426 domain-containing protein [Saccharospirillum sp.]
MFSRWLTATLLGCLALMAQAEQKIDFGNYELHYIVFNSTMLQPDIAARYSIPRSGQLAVVNLSVLEKQPNGVAIPREAEVQLQTRNLLGQTNPIELRMIREQNALYHLGTLRFDHRDVLRFDVTVTIPGERTFNTTFSQELWREDE